MKIFSGSSSRKLTLDICKYAFTQIGQIELSTFPSGESYCQYLENIRGEDVFLVQTFSSPVNESLMQLLIMIDAARRASAGRITAVIPYFAYSRQDRKDKPRVPISAKLIIDLLEAAGANRILTLDLHAPQIQGFTNLPLDHVSAAPIFKNELKYLSEVEDLIIISPDTGGIKRAEAFANYYSCDFGFVVKKRIDEFNVESDSIVGDVKGRYALILDDLTESCGTVIAAAKVCANNHARHVSAVITHPLINSVGWERLANSKIPAKLFVTDSVPLKHEDERVKVISVAPLFAEAITRIHKNQSVTSLFT